MTEESVSNTLPIGSRLHWYEVQDILGRGGYGITYLAFDRNLHRKVAIKEYLPSDFAHRVNNNTVHPITDNHGDLYSWGLERFLSEARTLAQFNHKAIIKVNSVFEQNNTAYMVMEYEEGDDLSVAYEKNKPFTQAQLLALFLPIIDGLALVHDAGFIHRDIKPANIYVRNDGSPVLLDFGSARQTLRSQTSALTTLVTTGYAPFEQYNQSDDEQGVWTDIYALGSTLYYCVTGDKPVDALKRSAGLIKKGRDAYEPISSMPIPGFSQNFLAAIDHALMFHSERRPHSARYWADMLSGKAGVAPVSQDLFTINHPGDTYYDLDSTVVMTAVKPVSFDEQTLIQQDSETIDPVQENILFQPAPDSAPLSFDDEQTIVRNPRETRQSDDQIHGLHASPHSTPIQPATSEQLDRFTEELARPAESPSHPSAQHAGHKRRDNRHGASKRVQELMEQSREMLWKGLGGLQRRVPNNILQKLQLNLQNRTLLLAALSVALILATVILMSIIFSDANTDREPLAAKSDTLVTSSGSTLVKSNPDPTMAATEVAELPLSDTDPVTQLLQQAQRDRVQGRVVEDDSTGAYYDYKKILQVDPQNQSALQAMEAIEKHYSDLVEANLQSKDWQQAKTNIAKYEIVTDDQSQLTAFKRQLAQHETTIKNIDNLLKLADRLFSQNKLTKPTSQNALLLYNEVLAIAPNHQAAQEGINNIIDKLGEYLQKQLTIDEISSAELTYNKIYEINPNAPILANTEPVLAKLLAQKNEIVRLLQQAKADFIRGNIVAPKDNNALDKYRSVIDIDPRHAKAKEGIDTIYQYYLSDFNRYLDEKRFDRADDILNQMTGAKFDRKQMEKLKKRLEKERVASIN